MSGRRITDMKDRILERSIPEPNTGCWLWLGAIMPNGYGRQSRGRGRVGKVGYAHRVSYEAFVGPIPVGLEIDHKCRQRACVNPQHLEPVTSRVNQLRGDSASGKNARKTHCDKGHEFTDANTYRPPRGTSRQCRKCIAARAGRAYWGRIARGLPGNIRRKVPVPRPGVSGART